MPVISNVALVIDALPSLGGAERVLMAVMELFPEAPIYTLIYHRPAFTHTSIASRQVYTSYLERLPGAHKQYRKFLPFMPNAIQQFNLEQYEHIISFSYAVAHGITTQPGQIHYSYTFTPMRYAWRRSSVNGMPKIPDRLLSGLLLPFRKWDQKVVKKIGPMASVSQWVRQLVSSFYQRDSRVIYPSVDVDRFSPQPQRENYYLTVTRLFSHKRVELMVEAFNQLHLPLLVVGDGPERPALERRANENIRFLGFQSDEKIASLLNRGRGYLCASEEDFGISMVEAQAAGCPVIAFGQGGALEIVQDGKTGIFFQVQSSEHLVEAVQRFEARRYNFSVQAISENAQRFNKRRFHIEFLDFVMEKT
jgi:glycosyltransferase involved in cell wall biosynthesis